MKKTVHSALVGAMLLAGQAVFWMPTQAEAANPRYMSCGELWYERNSIFADEGYCFRTRAAIRTFGERCYPPYGRLNRWEKERVNTLKYWERVKGCR